MSNNENKQSPLEFIKNIPTYQSESVQPLTGKVRDLKDMLRKAKDELTKKRDELSAVKKEEAAQAKIAAGGTVEHVEKPVHEAPDKVETIVKDAPVSNSSVEIVAEQKPIVVEASQPVEAKEPTTEEKPQQKTYINNDMMAPSQPSASTNNAGTINREGQQPRQYQPRENQGGNQNREGQSGQWQPRPNNNGQQTGGQGGQWQPRPNNNAPQTGGQGGQWQPRPNNNAPTGGQNGQWQPRPNNNAPTGGQNGQWQPRPNNNAPIGGQNGQWQPRPNNNAPTGGQNGQWQPRPNNFNGPNNFNNNRPGGNFAPRVPRLPRPDMAPPTAAPNRGVDNKKKKSNVEEPKKQQLNKRTLVRKGYVDESDFDENGMVKHVKQRRGKKLNTFTPNTVNIEHAFVNSLDVPIKTLAEKIGKTATDIVKKCFALGQMHNINSTIDFDTAELIASEFRITLEYKPDVTAEDTLNIFVQEQEGEMVKRPPVVTIMGHVDHGKTSLLDYIRKTRVASSEAGGITQHIGAYTINVKGEQITFLDTPGHEAFTAMRMRGAKITDIAIVVVAADDGIMPQTIEAFNHAKGAGVNIMVAINKIDKPAANVDKIMQQLTQHGIMPEEWGGDVMVTPLSAKSGQGVDDLLDNILLLAEVKELKAINDCPAKGSVIEGKLDKGIGPVATVLVQNGTLRVSDYVVAGTCTGKVRALIDDTGKRVKEAGPSIAVSVLGLSEVPNAGDIFVVVQDEKLAREVASERMSKEREEMQSKSARKNLEDMFKGMSDGEMKSLAVIIKGDVQGSVEAVKQAFVKLSDEMSPSGVKISILHAGVGAINESDVRLADTSSGIIVAFNVRPEPKAKLLADRSKVDIKTYRIIYDAIDDVTKALKGMLDPIFREEIIGHAEVREIFKITDVGTIAGCFIIDGKVARNAKFRLVRENVVVYDGKISSMKRNKDEAKEVATGYECGIGLENFNDIKIGDIIEAFLLKEEEQL